MTEDEMVQGARGGDRRALSALVGYTKDKVYNLAARMLGDPVLAEDATQEILIRVITGLATYRAESSLSTWVYRVAANQLLTLRKSRSETMSDSLEGMEGEIAEGLVANDAPLEDQVLITEAKLACTSRMILGLDRDHRLAFILGEILELSAEEGASVLEVSPEAFRKRLSRARERMGRFLQGSCGVENPERPCRCARQGARFQRLGFMEQRVWTCLPTTREADPVRVKELDAVGATLGVLRSHPSYAAPERLGHLVRDLIQKGTSDLWQ